MECTIVIYDFPLSYDNWKDHIRQFISSNVLVSKDSIYTLNINPANDGVHQSIIEIRFDMPNGINLTLENLYQGLVNDLVTNAHVNIDGYYKN